MNPLPAAAPRGPHSVLYEIYMEDGGAFQHQQQQNRRHNNNDDDDDHHFVEVCEIVKSVNWLFSWVIIICTTAAKMETEEPMDVDTTGDFDKFDDLLEEGEYVESNRVTRKSVASVISIPENKAGTFVTDVDIFSEEGKTKMEERARRFGLAKEAEKFALKEAERLYESFGIIESTESARNYRLNVLHVRGTERMSTKDVFKYFEDYAPASIEWINDISCNVVWLDKASAARAILGLSKKIIGVKKETNRRLHSDDDSDEGSSDDVIIVNGDNEKNENTIHIKDIRCPLPPGIWRKGCDYMDSRNIFLRFAGRSDRKQPHEEKFSGHKQHGNSNHGGLKGILTTSRKRVYKEIKKESSPIKTESSGNGIAAKNPWGSLSKNWGVADFIEDDYLPKAPIEPVSSVKDRLGIKPQRREESEEDSNVIELSDSASESSSDDESWCKRSKMPRMRMHADDEEEKIQKRKGKIRNMVNHRAKIKGNDLRGRLTAKRRLPPIAPVYHEAIQVIVTNPKAIHRTFRDVNVTEDEDEDEDIEDVIEHPIDDDEEEGEIIDDSDSDSKVEYEEEDDDDVEEVDSESESSASDTSDSSVSEKEVQGPKGSVIKVVQHKPKLQSTVSTVWSRLNNSKNDRNDDRSPERYHSKADLRHTLRKNDLRSRIGNHHMRGRSPLRIELRNDKYEGRQSDSE